MSFFGPESKSSSTDNRDAATDQAKILKGRGHKYLEKGSTDLSNAKISSTTAVKGLDLSNVSGSGNTITIGDASQVSDLTKNFLDTINSVSANSSAATAAAAAAGGSTPASDLTNAVNDQLKKSAGNVDG
jgi:hypothetical protein